MFSMERTPRQLSEFSFSMRHADDVKRARSSRQEIPWFVYFGDQSMFSCCFHALDVPVAPCEEALAKAKAIPEVAKKEIIALFESRPIISRLAIYCLASPLLRSHLKQLLPSAAYYFANGPWRHTWIRYGVDPRSCSDYRVYQVLECRNVYTLPRSAFSVNKGKRGGRNFKKANSAFSHCNAYIFDGLSMNGNYFLYQYIDLTFPEAAEIVNDQQLVCSLTEKEGWYRDGSGSRLREILRKRWAVLCKSEAPSYADFEMERISGDLQESQSESFLALMFSDLMEGNSVNALDENDDQYFIFDE